MLRDAHIDAVNALALSDDGRQLFSASIRLMVTPVERVRKYGIEASVEVASTSVERLTQLQKPYAEMWCVSPLLAVDRGSL